MTMARGELVDSSVTAFYHCISWFVRRAFLCGAGCEHRKQWIEDRLREVSGLISVEVAGFAVLDNHMHVVLKLNDEVAAGWSDDEVVRRWGRLFPPRGKAGVPHEVAEILARLGSSPEIWQQRMEKLRDRSRIFGTVFATKHSEINRMAESRGVKKLSNLNGCHS